MCYIHRINFQSIYQWPGISDTTWGKLYKIAPSLCLVLWHCKGPTHLWSSSLLSCKSQNLQTPLCDVAYIFCLRTWRVPAKDDFIQTSCDKDLGKHRILFTQVVVNNMSHQSWIYDKQPQLSKIIHTKPTCWLLGERRSRFTQTVHWQQKWHFSFAQTTSTDL